MANNHAYTDGTVDGLIKVMENSGVDISVTLPVLTKPSQFESVTKFAISLNERFNNDKKIISFGGMHPLCDNIHDKMKFLKDNGFKGVKIHPDYQGEYINHQGYIDIINSAKELDMIVVTHSGVDDGFKNQPVKCPPSLALEVIKKTNHNKFVLGHYGAHKQWQNVLEMLCDCDVFFDTAYTFYSIDEKLFIDILKRHGEDKILFSTDCPWSNVKTDIERFNSFNLTASTKEKILYKNACKLLDITY